MVFSILNLLINTLIILIFIRAILSWAPQFAWRHRGIVKALDSIVEPVVSPLRRILPPERFGGLDISPALAIVALSIVRQILFGILVARG